MLSENLNSNNPEENVRKKAVSARQLAANRANAQKSTGPRTKTGKDRSKFNNLKHGLTAKQVCIPGESPEVYEELRQKYIEILQPQNILEADAADDYVAARWRKKRVVKWETALIIENRLQMQSGFEETYEGISLDVESALAFKDLCDTSQSAKLLDRYETRIIRDLKASWELLRDIMAMRPDAPAAPPVEPAKPELPTEPICEQVAPESASSEAPQPAPDPEPDNEDAQMTIALRPKPVAQHSQLTTHNSQLITMGSQLTTPNSQLIRGAAGD